jgi:hypothetical protein
MEAPFLVTFQYILSKNKVAFLVVFSAFEKIDFKNPKTILCRWQALAELIFAED